MSLELPAWALGEVAGELLASGAPANVMGITSRGAFLRLGQGVIFLSTEPFRGPLTVNLVAGLPPGLEVGAEVTFDVILSEALPSSARDSEGSRNPGSARGPTPSLPRFSRDFAPPKAVELIPRLSRMIDLVLAARPDGEASDVLRTIAATSPFLEGKGGRGVGSLLGRGEGLTPWGDDLIIGLLLALYYLQPGVNFDSQAGQLTSAAFTKTSLLSANLIACAARGQADERLLLALNAILAGEPAVETGADCLLGWGNTSGVAALAGMAVVINGLEDS